MKWIFMSNGIYETTCVFKITEPFEVHMTIPKKSLFHKNVRSILENTKWLLSWSVMLYAMS